MSTKGRHPSQPELFVGDNAGEGAVRGSGELDQEFEFSRLVLGEEVPFESPQQSVDRTWQRLSRSTAHSNVGTRPRIPRLVGPVVAAAACVATFAAGVWVGGAKHAPLSPQVVSAEPIGVDERATRQPAVAGLAVEATTTPMTRQPDDLGDRTLRNRVGDGTHRIAGAHSAPNSRAGNWVPTQPEMLASATVPVYTVDPMPVAAVSNASGTSAWQKQANRGEYDAAQEEIERAGGFERILESASAEQLLLLSETARATGQQQRALAALRRIVSEHLSDPVAPLAALNMGNLLNKMGDGAGATRAFAVYRTLSPQGDFAEDALVGQIRSAVSAGQPDLAQRLVRQYEADFPEGRRADEVARWAEQIPTRSESPDAGASDEANKPE